MNSLWRSQAQKEAARQALQHGTIEEAKRKVAQGLIKEGMVKNPSRIKQGIRGGLFSAFGTYFIEGTHQYDIEQNKKALQKEKQELQEAGRRQVIIRVSCTKGGKGFWDRNKITPNYNEEDLQAFLELQGIIYNPNQSILDQPHDRFYTIQCNNKISPGEFEIAPDK